MRSFVVLLGLVAADFEAIGLNYQAAWGCNYPSTQNISANLQFSTSNLTLINDFYKQGGVSLYPFTGWTIPDPDKADPKTGLCHSPIPRFSNNTRCKAKNPSWSTEWSMTYKKIKPLIADGAIAGIFLGDEQMWAGVQLSDLEEVTDQIKSDCPSCITFINEAQDVAVCNFNRMNGTWAENGQCLPKSLDWFGFDYYDGSFSYGENSGWEVQRRAFEEQIYPRLHPHQRIIPTCISFFDRSAITREKADEYCAFNAQQYLHWALEDHRLIGVFPFYWPATQPQWWDLQQLPKCTQTWSGIGQIVKATPPSNPYWKPTSCDVDTPVRDYNWCDRYD